MYMSLLALLFILGLVFTYIFHKNLAVLGLNTTDAIPSFSHVFVIIEENHSYNQIINNTSAPYMNQLAKQYALATNLLAITHPSLPNYLAFTSGGTQGITSDCNTCFNSANNLFSLLESAGKTWKSYHESMPSNCYLNDAGAYVLHHNPAAYFTQLRTSCSKNDVPFSQFTNDLAQGSVGNFTFIVPDNNDDMHDGTIQQADSWLSHQIPAIMQSPSYQNNGLIIITWDEGDKNITPNHIPTIIISPLAKQGFTSSVSYNLYSILRTITDGLGVTALGAAAQAQPMSDFFNSSSTPSVSPPSSLTGTPPPQPSGIQPGHTGLRITVCPHDIGNCGDNVNAQSGGNTYPLHPTRLAQVNVFNSQNTLVAQNNSVPIVYNTSSENFSGLADMGSLPSGTYLIRIKTQGFLTGKVPGIVSVSKGRVISLPSVPLVNGDVNGDDQIDISDYNSLASCFGSKQQSSACTNPSSADLNDDGRVDGIDINVFIRELSVQRGAN